MTRSLVPTPAPVTAPRRSGRRAFPVVAVLALATLAALAVGGGRAWHLRAEWRAAAAALDADRPEDARAHLAACLRAWPDDLDVHFRAARAARLANDPAAAEAHLNRCLKGGATEAVQLEFLLLRAQTGDVEAVASPLIAAVEQNHADSPLILEVLARAYIVRLRYQPALACLNRWIELRPESAKAFQWRGFVLERVDNHKGAFIDYQRALDLNPDLTAVRLRVAEMYLEEKQAPEALPHLQRLHAQSPDDPAVLSRLGACQYLRGETAEARRLLEAALPRLPDDPVLLIALARVDLQDGRPADAEGRLRRVVARDRADTEARFLLATALQAQGKADAAAAELKEHDRYAAVLDRTNKLLKDKVHAPNAPAAVAAEVGALLLEVGKDRLGVYWLEEALARDPTCQPAHRALADHFAAKGDAARAADHRRHLRGPDPKK